MASRTAKYTAGLRAKRREKGLCHDCNDNAVPKHGQCLKHLEYNRIHARKARKRRTK